MNKTTFDIPCIVLCGGRSSRMKEDKSLLSFDNYNSLTQYQYIRLKEIFKEVYISSKTNKFDFLELKDLIIDKNEEYSPVVALESIFEKFKNQKVFIITVDNPFVKFYTIFTLIEASRNSDITVASTERIHNLCGVFSSSCLETVKSMLAQDIHKVGYLLKQMKTEIIKFDEEDEFLNLNTPDEYKKALDIISKTYE